MSSRMLIASALSIAITLAAATPGYALAGASDDAQPVDNVVPIDVGGAGIATVAVSLLDDRNVVPGDAETQRLRVRNTGDEDGRLSATITDVRFGGDIDDRFFDELLINGEPARELIDGVPLIAASPLPVGGESVVALASEFPTSSVAGNHADSALSVSFDVRLEVQTDAAGARRSATEASPHSKTGLTALPWTGPLTGGWGLAALAALIGGFALAFAGRRRRHGDAS